MLNFSAMNVQIQTVRFDADAKLIDHVNKRVQKLSTFYDRIVNVEVFLKLDQLAHQVKDKIAEIKVHIPRKKSRKINVNLFKKQIFFQPPECAPSTRSKSAKMRYSKELYYLRRSLFESGWQR